MNNLQIVKNEEEIDDNNSLFSTFIQTNINELIQIYITERNNRGEGILMITKREGNCKKDDKMDVRYLTKEQIPPELLQDLINKKKNEHKPSIIYFYVCMGEGINDCFWIEYNLDKNN